ncbi:MAG: prolipoprotein diacylglyceryl transferase [Lachnospiraceae bacterium]|nr:prolipoprotein diacylglyceryl transferase [Lachnospiraceae bacterium]
MLPYIDIFGLQLPMYGLLAIFGFILGVIVAVRMAKRYGIPTMDVLFASFYCAMGLIIGAKLLYFITMLPKFIANFDVFLANPFGVIMYVFGGFVFYGGLIGGALGVLLYCKQFHLSVTPFMNVAAPAIPLMHAFGRLGCLCAGCCYGMEYHGHFAITYPLNSMTQGMAGVPRFPTPLVEVAVNLILFVFLFIYMRKADRKPGQGLGIYLVVYSIMRFLLEFARADDIRGGILGLSTSQIISLLLLPFGIWLIVRKINSKSEAEEILSSDSVSVDNEEEN